MMANNGKHSRKSLTFIADSHYFEGRSVSAHTRSEERGAGIPEIVDKAIIDEFLDRHPDLRSELKAYADTARKGLVL